MKLQPQTKRIYLINRDFQYRFTMAGVAAGLVSTVLSVIVILYPLYEFKILVLPQFLPTPILVGMVAAALINIGMLVFFGILISHKIAGPMFSMVRQIRKLAAGQWRSEIKTRPGDDLRMLVRNLNDLSRSLVHSAEKDLLIVEQALETCSNSPATATQLEELRGRLLSRIVTSGVKKSD